jgi:beta-glucosidase
VTAFPAGIHAVSTWDVDLIRERGTALGEEARGKGVNVLLGPVAGALGKIPHGGRNWEGFSPDPYLAGIAMQETIAGIQGTGVQACAKHYIGNEQELRRNEMSSNIDDRTMHELYLWPFADAVKANVASFMCSYNRLGGTYACENSQVLNGLLKEELDFQVSPLHACPERLAKLDLGIRRFGLGRTTHHGRKRQCWNGYGDAWRQLRKQQFPVG